MKAAIYARYSTDNQREASIADQVRLCRRLIEQQGWTLARAYEDRALSGGSRHRPGYQQMLTDAEASLFDVIVVEALDRLGRKLADLAELHDRLQFVNVKIHAASTGEVTPMHIGMLGTMAQLYLSDLREKTLRGQLGRALDGKIPGGHAFGYDVVAPTKEGKKAERGERRINPAEARIVVRIFEQYAGGSSPRAIAKALNAAGVPGPKGRQWRDTAIRGQVDRGTGILNNAIYVGRLEWNRCSYIKNPRTGKRVARPNPPDAWEVVPVPELRIVSDELWSQVKTRQQAARFEIGRDDEGNALNRVHRRRFLLSGLLVCRSCGGGYTIMSKDRYGCATRRSKGTCDNSQTIKRQEIEARVLAGLKEKLLAPELVAAFVEEYQVEMNRLAKETQQQMAFLHQERSDIEKKIEGIMRAIEDQMYSPVMKDRMQALETRRDEIDALLSAASPPAPVRLHPGLKDVYRRKVARLEEALNDDAIKAEAMEIIRGMIEKIVMVPVDDGLNAELHGDLAEILAFCDRDGSKCKHPRSSDPGCQLSVVAGARNRRYLHLDHAIF
jgi:DNA invertase Pin-like site-specific DNA recombinase